MLLSTMTVLAATMAAQVTMSGPMHASHSKDVPAVVDCDAFRANKNGSWTAIRPTTVGSVSMTEGGTFFPGVQLDGIDVGEQLDASCRDTKKKP